MKIIFGIFLSDKEIRKKYRIENSGSKLIDFCDINVGIATLSDYIYLLNDYRIEVDGEIFNIEHEICKPL